MVKKRIKLNPRYGTLGTMVSLSEMKEIWDRQCGICPYTGWKMELPKNGSGWSPDGRKMKRASIDRIDPKLGYTKENVQFTSFIANIAKNDFNDSDLLDFCLAVIQNGRSGRTCTDDISAPNGTP